MLGAKCGRFEVAVEHEWVEVESVGPHDRAVVDGDLSEEGRILQRLEHRTPKVVGKVDVARAAIVERQVQAIRRPHMDLDYSWNPGDLRHGSGSMLPGS